MPLTFAFDPRGLGWNKSRVNFDWGDRGFLSLIGALAVLCSVEQPARACTIGFGPTVHAVGTTFPSNGVIGIQSWCVAQCDGYGPPMGLEVTDAEGQLVPGSIIDGGPAEFGYWAAWKPDAQPAVDAQLSVREMNAQGAGFPANSMRAITVTEPNTLDTAALDFALAPLVFRTPIGPGACCVDGPRDSCNGALPCLYEEGTARMRTTVEFEVDPALVGQFAYRVLWSAAGNPEVQSDFDIVASKLWHEFDVEAAEYCATITIARLADGVQSALETRCVPHGEGPLGVTPWPAASNDRALVTCSVPPPEFEAEWCARLDEVSSCTPEASACMAAMERCGSQPSSGSPDPVPADDTAPAPVPADDTELRTASTDGSGGCALGAPAGRAGQGGWLWLLGLGLSRGRRKIERHV